MARKNPQSSTTRRLHRSIGISAAVFAIFMIASGLVLNHSNQLGLDQHHVSQSLLLRWYGLSEPKKLQSFAVGDQWLTFAGAQLYLDDKHVTATSNGVGAVASGEWLVAASADELLLLERNGSLIERLPWGPPGAGSIVAVGRAGNGAVVVKAAGQLWLSDKDLLDWQALEAPPAKPMWSSSELAPETLRQEILQQYRGQGLSLERLLLDTHSGRIFGTAGLLVYDLLALALGFLALSGLILWVRGRRNGQRNGNGRR